MTRSQRLTRGPGNGAPRQAEGRDRGRLVRSAAVGTEDVNKVYAERFKGPEHLTRIQEEARDVVAAALNG